MKRFLLRILLFLSLPFSVAVIWTTVVVALDLQAYRASLSVPVGCDTLVCADSQTRASLNPEIISNLFNFSTAATHPDQNFLRLLDVLEVNRGKIKYVLLDVTPLHVGFDERMSPLSEAGSARVHAFVHIYRWRDSQRPLGSAIRLFRDVVFVRKPNEIRKAIKRGNPYRSSLSGGFYSAKHSGFMDCPEKALNYAEKMADKFNGKSGFSCGERTVDILKASVSAIRKAEACPLLMTTPIAYPALMRMEKEKLFAFTNGLAVVAADLGIPYLNHLSENIPEECWRDANHLNEKGAERFSVIFKRELKRVCQHSK